MDHLQWVCAIKMRVKTADKSITILKRHILLVYYCDVCHSSFWRRPFTAEDPLVFRNNKSFTSWMAWGRVNFQHIYIYIYIHTYVCMYVCVYVYTHTYIPVYIYIYIYIYMYMCVYMCVYIYRVQFVGGGVGGFPPFWWMYPCLCWIIFIPGGDKKKNIPPGDATPPTTNKTYRIPKIYFLKH